MSIYRFCVSVLHSLQFLPVRDHCPPASFQNVSAWRVFGRPFLRRLSVRPTLMQCLSICAGPLLPHGLPLSTSDCQPMPRVPLFWYSFLFELSSVCLSLHTTCSILRSIFRWKVWSTFFPPPRVTMFGCRIPGPAIRRISGRLSLSPVFLVFVGQYKPYTLSASINPILSNLLQIITIIFLSFSSHVVPE
jgi:hypothetical protein